MAVPIKAALLFCLFLSLFLPSSAQTCSSYTFSQNRIYNLCNSLPVLSSSLHWNYHPSNGTVDIAYRASQSSNGFVAWGINPTGQGMLGTQTLFGFQNSNGAMTVYLTGISTSSYSVTVKDGNLSFPVSNKVGEFANNVMTIYATLTLPNNSTRVNTAWQAGSVANGLPVGHPTTGANIQSSGSLDFLSGESSSTSGGNSRLHRRNIHGVLNAISWGILLPMGAIIARYLKVFKSADPAWFYLHVACQLSAYIVGVAGWGLGLKLGSESVGIKYSSHRDIGIALFCLGTLQIFALLLRPNKDHKFRIYWNLYHWSVGYCVIILSVVNIFKGFDILNPDDKWKTAYIAIIATLGGIAVVLEAFTWLIVLKRKSRGEEKSHHGTNGVNGGNGYGGRNQAV